MNLDRAIVALVRCDPAPPTPLRHLCALLFPTFSWDAAQAAVAPLIRTRCAELVIQGRIVEVGIDNFIAISYRRSGIAMA